MYRYLHLADGIGDRLQESVQPLTLLSGHVPHLLLGIKAHFNFNPIIVRDSSFVGSLARQLILIRS
jgi:hypothetical protein